MRIEIAPYWKIHGKVTLPFLAFVEIQNRYTTYTHIVPYTRVLTNH